MSPDGSRVVARDYAEARLSEARRIVQEQVLETLGQSENPEDVHEAVKAILPERTNINKNAGRPFVYSSNLKGVKTFVVGYDWAYGPTAIPGVEVVIDGFRKTGLAYELAAETDGRLEGCALTLDRLDSPRTNEAWFLAHASIVGASHYVERIRILSFDGYQFKQLWTSIGEPWMEPAIKITREAVTIDYCGYSGACEPKFQETILLTSGGPVGSTVEK